MGMAMTEMRASSDVRANKWFCSATISDASAEIEYDETFAEIVGGPAVACRLLWRWCVRPAWTPSGLALDAIIVRARGEA